MKFVLSLLTLATSSLIGVSGFAQTSSVDELATHSQKIFSMFNDRDTSHSDFNITVDDKGAINGINYTTFGGTNAVKNYTIAETEQADGVVLEEGQGIKAVTMHGHIDATQGHGRWTFHFVSNGLTGSYSDCTVNMQRAPNGSWQMINPSNNAVVEKAKLVIWSLGISTIKGICPANIL